MNAHSFIQITVILQNAMSYMFRTLMAHHEGARVAAGVL